MNFHSLKKFFSPTYRRIFGFVSLCLIFGSLAVNARADDEQDIRGAFGALQKAFAARDGTQALTLISADTKDYYRMLSNLASSNLSLKKLESQHLTPLNLFMLKHTIKTFPKSFWADYKKNNPDKLLKFAIDKGLGSQELTDNIRLGKVELNGETAMGKLLKGAKVLPLQLGFLKETGKWKVSLISMFEQANRAAEEFLKKSGLTVQDLEKMLLDNK